MKKIRLSSFSDKILVATVIALCLFGLVATYTASTTNVNQDSDLVVKQSFYFVVGLLVMIFFSLVNYRKLAEHSVLLYILSIILLALPTFFGVSINNAKRWVSLGFTTLQTSEIVKPLIVVILAKYLEIHRGRMGEFKSFIFFFLILSIPMGLIFIQPDLGTALIFVPSVMSMLLISGMPLLFLSGVVLMGLATLAIPINTSYSTVKENTYLINDIFSNLGYLVIVEASLLFVSVLFYFLNLWRRHIIYKGIAILSFFIFLGFFVGIVSDRFLLKDYQRNRILSFISPHKDTAKSGYNAMQAQIAIGSGKLWGKGFMEGTQGYLGFLPSRTTDFIFSIIGEEFGFVGLSTILMAFALFFYRLMRITLLAKDYLGGIIIVGLSTIFYFQIFINVAMNLGVAPVTGIPLPFISYGGSSLLSSFISVGIILNINRKRYTNLS